MLTIIITRQPMKGKHSKYGCMTYIHRGLFLGKNKIKQYLVLSTGIFGWFTVIVSYQYYKFGPISKFEPLP